MRRLLSIGLAILCLVAGGVRADTFQDGDAVCFLGDSITHGGPFHGIISTYYLTRFPDRTIHFVNAGIAGDSAGGALGRLGEDVVSKSPSTVVVMMGMNDVGRGNYVAEPTAKQRESQARALQGYAANLEKLLDRVRSETKAKLVLLTPSPFDQTCVNDRNNNQPGCNDALGQCAQIVRQFAPKYQAAVVDLHGPMTALNLQRQKSDPTYTLIGPDRVHPGLPGHLMMAWLFLKSQDAPALVSTVAFDAAAGRVREAANASVSDIRRKGDGWTFTVLEKALPFAVDEKAREMLAVIPLEKSLNQEIVRFTGLLKGSHVLTIDGTAVGCQTAAEWSDGVNLAFNRATPQVKQAEKVAELNDQRRRTEVRLRGYACVRWFLRHRGIDPDDLAAVRTYAETKMEKKGYYEAQVPTYLVQWEHRHEVEAQVTALEQETLHARVPVAHTYEIHPAR